MLTTILVGSLAEKSAPLFRMALQVNDFNGIFKNQ